MRGGKFGLLHSFTSYVSVVKFLVIVEGETSGKYFVKNYPCLVKITGDSGDNTLHVFRRCISGSTDGFNHVAVNNSPVKIRKDHPMA